MPIRLIDWRNDAAISRDARDHAEAMAPWHQHHAILGHKPVDVVPGMPPDLEHILEAMRRVSAQDWQIARQHRIGGEVVPWMKISTSSSEKP